MNIIKLKKIQLRMLEEVIKICNENNIKYFLLGGTLLGSVRHQGFIPWDDDIDIGMYRVDYEKFLRITPDLLASNYFLQTNQTDPNYLFNFAKIRNNDTTFIEKSLKNHKINHGVYIDVFPLDVYLDLKIDNFRRFVLKRKILTGFYSDEKTLKENVKKIVGVLSHIAYPKSIKSAIKYNEKLMIKYNSKKHTMITNYCGAWGKKEIVPVDWFGEGTEGVFEGVKVTIPSQWDKYLTQVYGDYMTQPPKEKQIGHHYCTIIDLEKSYKEYM